MHCGLVGLLFGRVGWARTRVAGHSNVQDLSRIWTRPAVRFILQKVPESRPAVRFILVIDVPRAVICRYLLDSSSQFSPARALGEVKPARSHQEVINCS